jgi:hypothetical protein
MTYFGILASVCISQYLRPCESEPITVNNTDHVVTQDVSKYGPRGRASSLGHLLAVFPNEFLLGTYTGKCIWHEKGFRIKLVVNLM